MKNLKRIKFSIIILLHAVALGAWAQTSVTTENELRTAVQNGGNVTLGNNIELSDQLEIASGKTVTIDLNGKTLSRSVSSHTRDGNVIWVNGGSLTIDDSSGNNSGVISGVMAYNGAGINVASGGSLTFNSGTISNNNVSRYTDGKEGRGGGIMVYENATLTITGDVFDGNTAYQGGAVYIMNGATATIMGGTFRNGGASGEGGAIWSDGTLNIQGAVSITGNKGSNGQDDNVYLTNGKVINITGSLTGSSIGVCFSNYNRKFTSGYSLYNSNILR